MSLKRAPNELLPRRCDTPRPTGLRQHHVRDSQTPSSHIHNRTRQDDAPSPAWPRKRNFPSYPRASRPRLSPLLRPALTFLSGFSVHAALSWVRGVLAGAKGVLRERAPYLPGLTLGLTARGWKAPRGLTSDPLSSPPRSPRPPPPALREKTNFVRSAANYAHPRGACRRQRGASPRPPRPEGAGPRGHLLPAPTPTLRNAKWPPKRSGGNPASG